jgi:tRNA-dihydrouridine synthase 2
VIIIGPELLSRQIDMLCVGFRKVADRPRGPTQWDGVAEVVSALSIPVIANGDVFEESDFQCIEDATGRLLL